MALKHTFEEVRRHSGRVVSKVLWAILVDLDERITDAEAGVVAAGSIGTDEIANLAVTEQKIGTGAVTSGKIGNGAVSASKLSGEIKYGSGAGYTIALVQTAFGDPAVLSDGFVGIYRDTTGTKDYFVTVSNDVFVAEELSAVPAG